jgi:hypothetical protein
MSPIDLSYINETPSAAQEQGIQEAVNEACLNAIIQYLTEVAEAMEANDIPALNLATLHAMTAELSAKTAQ